MATVNTIYRSLTDKNYYRLSAKGVVQIKLDDETWVNTDKAPEYLDRVCTSNERVNGCATQEKSTVTRRRGWFLRLFGRGHHV